MSFPLISASITMGYQIPASLRLRSSAGAYISYTPSVTGNQKTWTLSTWLKRGALGAINILLEAGTLSQPYTLIAIDNNNIIQWDEIVPTSSVIARKNTTAAFRDVSAWYHLVFSWDTTNVIAANRQIIYVNGQRVTTFSSNTEPPQNTNSQLNNTNSVNIGALLNNTFNFDGYISEVNFIDGQALTPAAFGQFDGDGNWKAKQYTGSYGANGFYLPFTDTTSTTTLVQNRAKLSPKFNMSVVGDTKWSTAQSKFSDKSIYFDGTGDYLAHPNSASLATGSANFTIEGWVYPITLTGASKIFLAGQGDYTSAAGSSFITYLGGSSNSDLYYGSSALGVTSPNPIVGQWNHLAWVREGTNWTSYLNGNRVATASGIGTNAVNAGSNAYAAGIGGATNNSGANTFNGYFSEVHMVTGVAKYSGATYTVPSIELSNISADWPNVLFGIYGSAGSMAAITTFPATIRQVFTPNNISLANDFTYDSMRDVPLGFGGGEFGNYATLNSLSAGGGTILNGNMTASSASDSYKGYKSTLSLSDKVYWEVRIETAAQVVSVGVASSDWILGLNTGQFFYHYDGGKYINGVNLAYGAPSFTTGDLLGFTFEKSTGTVICYKNNVSCGALITGLAGEIFAACTIYGTGSVAYNFGQRPFTYTPPAGFKPLHTGVFNAPLIANPKNHFDIVTRVGVGGVGGSVSSLNFAPGLLWDATRSRVGDKDLHDSVRGAPKYLLSNTTGAEVTGTVYNFTSNGYTISSNDWPVTDAVVEWIWKAGTTVTNTDGSITSQVSANPAAGFSIVKYTGNSALTATVGHGLGTAPALIFVKELSTNVSGWNGWATYHKSVGPTGVLFLNATSATLTTPNAWADTAPTSSVFTIRYLEGAGVNYSSNYIAYCFSEIAGYSKIGSYTGNGSADGTFVYCGFRPRWILIKNSDSSTPSWRILDTSRDSENVSDAEIYPNLTNAESIFASLDFTATGFKIRNSDIAYNSAGNKYIFIAIAEAPLKYALAR
jgi:hypothetical protein